MTCQVIKLARIVETTDKHCGHLLLGDVAAARVITYHHGGTEYSTAYCLNCWDSFYADYRNEHIVCCDCGEFKVRKDTIEWRPLDFDPRAGQPPRTICLSCARKVAHKRRVEADNLEFENSTRMDV